MFVMVQLFLNILFFLVIPVVIWIYLRKAIPLTILPILVGIILSIICYRLGIGEGVVPSPSLSLLGWLGILLLVFSAGLESVTVPERLEARRDCSNVPYLSFSNCRLLISASFALVLPFAIGTAIAYWFLLPLEGWNPHQENNLLAAAAIGLCLTVSALPVLVGLVRELPKKYRLLGFLAVRISVIDDFMLWVGLASLLLLARGTHILETWRWFDLPVVFALIGLFFISHYVKKCELEISKLKSWLIAGLTLAIGAGSTSFLGLHPFLGAYFAGILLPKTVVQKLYPEKLGFFVLVCLAPFFFGQSGLNVDGSVFDWKILTIAFALVMISAVAKIFTVLILPPAKGLSRIETIALGSLLQCKGLMEIVVASMLQEEGLLTRTAYTALVTLAVLSTIMTRPLFHWITKAHSLQAEGKLKAETSSLG
jgi:Kef-type K+ transport system membrane component KefB